MQGSEPQIELTQKKKIGSALNEVTSNSIVVASQPNEKSHANINSQNSSSLPNPPHKQKATIKDIIKFIVAFAVIIAILIWYWRKPATNGQLESSIAAVRNIKEGVVELNQTVGKKYSWLRQKVDHLNPSDDRFFYQRIFVNTENTNSKTISPVFLYLPPLHPIGSTQDSYTFTKYIEEKRGISLGLEMRYFGQSRPFYENDAYSLQNLKYLSLQQMVEDVAYAIQRIIDNRFFGISDKNKWIINGMRVSGTVAAWVRAKYPNLSSGAIASSPMLPTILAPLINQRIYSKIESSGKKCRAIIEKIRLNLQEELYDDRKQQLIYFVGQGVPLSPQEILYFYEKRIDIIPRSDYIYSCHDQTEASLLASLRVATLSQQYSPFNPMALSQRMMSSREDWTYFQDVRTARANWYLRCTQLGLFQTFPTEKSFASPRINQTFFRERCKSIFGADLWPNPEPLLQNYTPLVANATNLLVVHGYYDIYLPYALNGSKLKNQTIVKRCIQCEESFDYQRYFSMPDQIQETLGKQKELLEKWLRK